MSQEAFFPEQRAVITDLIRRVIPYKNAMIFGQAIVEISLHLRMNPLQEMEEILRSLGSDTYLIAIPMVETDQFQSKMPHSGDREYPIYLWTCVNGREEAEAKMREVETTVVQNFIHLENTGMLVPKPGSQLSQSIHAPLN